jgi:lysozyme
MLDGIIDTSHWDPIHDSAAMRDAGIVAVIAKATEGVRLRDDQFAANKSASAGLLFAAYHFLDHSVDAENQADFFIDTVRPDGKTGIVLDFEAGTIAEAEAFAQRIYDIAGLWPMLYTRASYITSQIGGKPTPLSNCPLWVASYRDTPMLPPQWSKWALWQYTNGEDGPEPHVTPGVGTSGLVDRSRFDGTSDALHALWQTITPRNTPVVIPPLIVPRWVKATLLNVRAGPGVNYTVLATLKQGTQVNVNGARITNGFVPYVMPGGAEGWVSAVWLVNWSPPAPVPIIPVVPPPPVISVGYGVQALGGAYDAHLAQYPAFKAIDNPGAVADYHRRNPNGLCIHRHYYSDTDQAARLAQPTDVAVAQWMAESEAAMAALPFALHEGFNEAGSDPRHVAFEIARVKALATHGYRACVLNLNTGTYNDDALWRRADIQQLAALIVQHNGTIGLHAYGEGIMSSNVGNSFWKQDGSWSGGELFPATFDTQECWLAMRPMRVREVLAEANLHPQIIATELGLDDNVQDGNGVYAPLGLKTRGWKDCIQVWQRMNWLQGMTPSAFYLAQLDWWVKTTKMPGLVYAWNDQSTGLDGKPGVFDVKGLL